MNYNYNKNTNLDGANKTATQLLKSYFNPKSILINDPVFLISHTATGLQVTVQLSYYQAVLAGNNLILAGRTDRINALTNALTQVYESAVSLKGQKSVKVQLELVRKYRPYMDASILAQYLAINASKHGFNRMMNLLLNAVPYLNPDYAFNLSCITGVKVQLSGLLTSQRNRSRKSVYTASAGTFSQTSNDVALVNNIAIDYASHTSKSRLGAFTVKV
jgi:ribosomal protein S3